jgi:hypothetical protein
LTELISWVVDALSREPAARLALGAGAGAADGAAADGAAVDAVGVRGLAVAGRLGFVVFRGAGAAVLSVGRSFSVAVVSTGASCRSRLRLSAVAVFCLSARPQAATAANVSATIIVLDI